jgi:predicted SprT family Zn-dependent metalloprotease
MPEPEWATSLIEKVLAYKKRSRKPKVRWVQRNRQSTSGVCYLNNKITICLGKDEWQWKPILLHELSHWLGRKRWHHNKKFWLLLRELLIEFDCYTPEYLKKEFEYISKSKNYL